MPDVLKLTVVVGYTGLKATQYFSKYTPEAEAVLFRDLDELKLPHPQRKNVAQASHGRVKFWWPQAFDNGTLHKHLRNRIKGDKRDDNLLQALSISTLTLQEDPVIPTHAGQQPPSYSPSHQQVTNTQPRGEPSSVPQNIPSKRPPPVKPPPQSNPSNANPPRPRAPSGQAQVPSGGDTEVPPARPPKRRKVDTEPSISDAGYPPMRFQPASTATSSSSSATYPTASSHVVRPPPAIPPSNILRFQYPQPYPPPPPPTQVSEEYTPFQPWLTSRPSTDSFANYVWPPAQVPAPPQALYPTSTVPAPQQTTAQATTQAPVPIPLNQASTAEETSKMNSTSFGEGDDKFTIVELLRKATQFTPAVPSSASASASTSAPRVNSPAGVSQPQVSRRTESSPAGSASQAKTLPQRDARSHFVRSSTMGTTSTSTPMQALQTLRQFFPTASTQPSPAPQPPVQGLPSSAGPLSISSPAPSQSAQSNFASSAMMGATTSVPAVVSTSTPMRTEIARQSDSPASAQLSPAPRLPFEGLPASAASFSLPRRSLSQSDFSPSSTTGAAPSTVSAVVPIPIPTEVSGQSNPPAPTQPPPAPQPLAQGLPASAASFSLPRRSLSQSDPTTGTTSTPAVVTTSAPLTAVSGQSDSTHLLPTDLVEAPRLATQASRARTVSIPPVAAGTWRESPVKAEPEEITIDLTAPVAPSSSSSTSYSDLLKSIAAAAAGATPAVSSAPVAPKTETREDANALGKSTSYSDLLKSITASREAAATASPSNSAPGSAGHRSASVSQTSSRPVSEDVRWLEAELSRDSPVPPPPSSAAVSWPDTEVPNSTSAAPSPGTYSNLLKSIRASATGDVGGDLSRHSIVSDATHPEMLQVHTPAPPTPSTPTSYSDLLKSLSRSRETTATAPASARMGVFVLDGTSPAKPVTSSARKSPEKGTPQVEVESSSDFGRRSTSGIMDMDLGTPCTPVPTVESRISATPTDDRKPNLNLPAPRDISLPHIETWVDMQRVRTELGGLPLNSEVERSLKRADMEIRMLHVELDNRASERDKAREENSVVRGQLEEERTLRADAERAKAEAEEERRKEINALKGQLEEEQTLRVGAERAKSEAEEERRKETTSLIGQLENERTLRVVAEQEREKGRKVFVILMKQLEREQKLRAEAERGKAEAEERRRNEYDHTQKEIQVLKQLLEQQQRLRLEAERAKTEAVEERRNVYENALKQIQIVKQLQEEEQRLRLEAQRAKAEAEERRRREIDNAVKHIQASKQQLEEEQRLRLEAQQAKAETEERTQRQVEEERRLRVVAEEALADVKRECKEPFVVPALFDAFMSISKLTTKVVGKKD